MSPVSQVEPEVAPPFRRAPAPPRTRETAMGRGRKVALIVGASAAVLAPFLLYVWAHVQIVTLGYRIEETEARLKALEQENRALRLSRGRGESLPSIEARAKKLGLVPVEPARIVVVLPQGGPAARTPPPLPAPAPSPAASPAGGAAEARR